MGSESDAASGAHSESEAEVASSASLVGSESDAASGAQSESGAEVATPTP